MYWMVSKHANSCQEIENHGVSWQFVMKPGCTNVWVSYGQTEKTRKAWVDWKKFADFLM
jgi:uncharacterized membrane protein